MARHLYRWLVILHPPQFRRRFGDEILCIFDEAGAGATSALLVDGLISLLRQWVLRSDFPKMLAAFLGAALQMTLAGFGWLAATHWIFRTPLAPRDRTPAAQITGPILLFLAGLVTAIVMAAIILAAWFTNHCTRRVDRMSRRAERNGRA
jgi:hypothetical protein